MESEVEDPQGKNKELSLKARSAVIWSIFIISACAGFLVAQVAYVYVQSKHNPFLDDVTSQSRSSGVELDEGIPLWEGAPRSELERTLRIVAPPQGGEWPEVLVVLSTYNLVQEGMLGTFLDTLLQSGVKNYLIVGLDKEIRDYLVSKGFNVYFHQVADAEKIAGHNHAVSALKFGVLKSILELGWNVLLSDTDVVILKNPFNHLYRDHDIEAMSDGFDDGTAFGKTMGFDDEKMGWARYAQGTQHLNLNSGLFYARSNKRTVALMGRIADHLESHQGEWDQAIFNHQLFFLSHGEYVNPGCSVRVMELHHFMNSKVLFRSFRFRPVLEITGDKMPVMIHMNYHPDKLLRMRASIQFFLQGVKDALKPFTSGSEPGT